MSDDKADLLIGVRGIASYLGHTERATQHLIDRAGLPVFRIGPRVHARKSRLDAWLVELEGRAELERLARDPPPDARTRAGSRDGAE